MVTAAELRRLPLVHGSMRLKHIWENVKSEGLRVSAGKKAGNTLDWDVALGRHRYVFLRPASTHAHGYGFGDVVVVRPTVLEKPGVRCLLNDPAIGLSGFQEIDMCLVCGAKKIKKSVTSYITDNRLAMVVLRAADQVAIQNEDDWQAAMRRELLSPDGLPSWYEENLLEPEEFYRLLAAKCNERDFSIADFVGRRIGSWSLDEEICIPERVEPEYILGRVRENECMPIASDNEGREQLDLFLKVLNNARDNQGNRGFHQG